MLTCVRIMSPVHRGAFASSFEIWMPFVFFLPNSSVEEYQYYVEQKW